MCVKIVTDSTCDLPKAVIEKLGITVLPCNIHFASANYLDGVDISHEEFYAKLSDSSSHPTSAAPTLGSFVRAYNALIENGASAILSIHLSSKLASTYGTAVIAAESVAKKLIHPFDSGQLSLGTGFLVEAAAKAAQAGDTLEAIVDQINRLARRTYAFAAADTLKYLRSGGRISQIVASVGTLLQIRPILQLHLGQVKLELARTSRQSLDKLAAAARSLGPLERLSIVHTNAPEKAEALKQAITALLPNHEIDQTVDVSPTIGVHFGPGAVGFAATKADS